jgi:hypothetical protein
MQPELVRRISSASGSFIGAQSWNEGVQGYPKAWSQRATVDIATVWQPSLHIVNLCLLLRAELQILFGFRAQ